MKEYIEVPQFETVHEKDPMILTAKVNESVMEHRNEKPAVTWEDGTTARISFLKLVRLFEEEQELFAKFTCGDCPLYKPQRKKNGEEDARSKHGDCIFAMFGRSGRDTAACEKLYEMIKNGMVRLRLTDEAIEDMEG